MPSSSRKTGTTELDIVLAIHPTSRQRMVARIRGVHLHALRQDGVDVEPVGQGGHLAGRLLEHDLGAVG